MTSIPLNPIFSAKISHFYPKMIFNLTKLRKFKIFYPKFTHCRINLSLFQPTLIFELWKRCDFRTEIDTFSSKMLSQWALAMLEMKSGDVITDGDFKIEISSPGSVRDQILDSNRFWVLPQLYNSLSWNGPKIETIISSGLRLLNCHPSTYTKDTYRPLIDHTNLLH